MIESQFVVILRNPMDLQRVAAYNVSKRIPEGYPIALWYIPKFNYSSLRSVDNFETNFMGIKQYLSVDELEGINPVDKFLRRT